MTQIKRLKVEDFYLIPTDYKGEGPLDFSIISYRNTVCIAILNPTTGSCWAVPEHCFKAMAETYLAWTEEQDEELESLKSSPNKVN